MGSTNNFAAGELPKIMPRYQTIDDVPTLQEALEGIIVEDLKKNGVTIVDNIESYDYGKFVHILDAEGNKIELWEPVD